MLLNTLNKCRTMALFSDDTNLSILRLLYSSTERRLVGVAELSESRVAHAMQPLVVECVYLNLGSLNLPFGTVYIVCASCISFQVCTKSALNESLCKCILFRVIDG